MKKLLLSSLFLVTTFYFNNIEAADTHSENLFRNKLEKAAAGFNGKPNSSAKMTSSNFRVNQQKVLLYNSTAWDTISKTDFSYVQGSLISLITVSINMGSGVYDSLYRYGYTYNTQGEVLSTLYEFWNGSSFDYDAKQINSYNSFGDKVTETQLTWNGAAWDTTYSERYNYVYNVNNHATELRIEFWDSGTWINDTREFYMVNAQGEWTDYIFQTWSDVLNIWENVDHVYNISWYNFGNLDFLTATIQSWNGLAFVDDARHTQTFNGGGNKTSELEETWTGSAWENSYRTQNTFVNNLLTISLSQEWIASWVNTEKEEFTWDAYGNNLISDYYEWTGGTWFKYSAERHTYGYDANNNIKNDILETFDGTTAIWSFVVQYLYSYDNITGIPVGNNKGIVVYPNPANSDINISGIPAASHGVFSIYDFSGKLIRSASYIGGGNLQVETSDLKNGMYIIMLESDRYRTSTNFIKQ